jgi:hypothetical protein
MEQELKPVAENFAVLTQRIAEKEQDLRDLQHKMGLNGLSQIQVDEQESNLLRLKNDSEAEMRKLQM